MYFSSLHIYAMNNNIILAQTARFQKHSFRKSQLFHINIWEKFNAPLNLSVIRQKDESQNGCYKKTKLAKFSQKKKFLTLDTQLIVRVFNGNMSYAA